MSVTNLTQVNQEESQELVELNNDDLDIVVGGCHSRHHKKKKNKHHKKHSHKNQQTYQATNGNLEALLPQAET